MHELTYRIFYTLLQSCFEVSKFQLRVRKRKIRSEQFHCNIEKVCSEQQRTKQNHRERRERERGREREVLDSETRRWRVSSTVASEFDGGARLVVAFAARRGSQGFGH